MSAEYSDTFTSATIGENCIRAALLQENAKCLKAARELQQMGLITVVNYVTGIYAIAQKDTRKLPLGANALHIIENLTLTEKG